MGRVRSDELFTKSSVNAELFYRCVELRSRGNKHEPGGKGMRAERVGVVGEDGRERGWRRRTLPHSYPCSTLRAGRLNDRVRDGAGCTPAAGATNHFFSRPHLPHTASPALHPFPRGSCVSHFLALFFSPEYNVLLARRPTSPHHTR